MNTHKNIPYQLLELDLDRRGKVWTAAFWINGERYSLAAVYQWPETALERVRSAIDTRLERLAAAAREDRARPVDVSRSGGARDRRHGLGARSANGAYLNGYYGTRP